MRCRVVGVLCVISIGAGCGKDQVADQVAKVNSVTCGQIRADDSWRSVAANHAELTPHPGPDPSDDKIVEFERLYRQACEGAPDDLKAGQKVDEIRGAKVTGA